MTRITARFVVAAAILILPAPAAAQFRPGIMGYVTYGSTSLESTRSFETIAGTSSATNIGGGATVTRLWRGIFADVAFSQFDLDGERVFVHEGTTFRLGIPVEITMRPVDVAAGWRATFGRVSPYGGAGVSFVSYKETSPFAIAGEDVNESKSGPMVLAGVDLAVLRWVHVGGEVRYRAVKGVLGEGGVSQAFGEDQIGGTAVAVRVSVGR